MKPTHEQWKWHLAFAEYSLVVPLCSSSLIKETHNLNAQIKMYNLKYKCNTLSHLNCDQL